MPSKVVELPGLLPSWVQMSKKQWVSPWRFFIHFLGLEGSSDTHRGHSWEMAGSE